MPATRPSLHIDSRQLVSRRRRVADAFLTAFMWILYSYLWAPLISLVAWLLGFEFAYDVMVRAGGFQTLKEVFGFYTFMVTCIFVVVAGWSVINRRRYGYRDRRHEIEPVADRDIAAFFGIEDAQLKAMRDAQVSRIRLNEDGQIESVEARILCVDIGSTGPVGPEGAVAENEPGDDHHEDDPLIQRLS